MRHAMWGGTLGIIVGMVAQVWMWETIDWRSLVLIGAGGAVLGLVFGKPLLDWIKSRFQKPYTGPR